MQVCVSYAVVALRCKRFNQLKWRRIPTGCPRSEVPDITMDVQLALNGQRRGFLDIGSKIQQQCHIDDM